MPTKDEREKRNAAERERYASMTDEQRAELLANHATWKKNREIADPAGHATARAAQIAAQNERYRNDPEYRERIKAYQREAARKRRAAAKAAKLAS